MGQRRVFQALAFQKGRGQTLLRLAPLQLAGLICDADGAAGNHGMAAAAAEAA